MKEHNISIDKKYFEPVREGKITLLFFNRKIIHNEEPGDCLIASRGSYDVKGTIKRTYMKSFHDITNEEAQKGGFLNKDFLKDNLIKEFDLDPIFDIEVLSKIDDEIFFIIELENMKKDEYINNTFNVDLYTKEYDIEDYYLKNIPWRTYYDKEI